MSASLDVLVQAALITQLQSPVLTSPATPIAYPFVPFTPTGGVAYLDVRPVMRGTPQNPSFDFTGSNLYRGVFQVDVVIPDTGGEAPALIIAGLIAARFAAGTVLVAGPYKLQLNKVPTIAAAVKDAPWVRFPVSIPYLVIA